MKRTTVHCALLALFLLALPLASQTGVWSAAGSTGSIDEASLGLYAVSTTALFHQGAAQGTVVARFDVTNTFGGGITDTPPWTTLELSYFDIDAATVVSATLFRVDRCSNVVSVVCGVNSIDATSPRCVSCTFPAGTINFGTHHYVVEARVVRNSNSLPQLFGLRIF